MKFERLFLARPILAGVLLAALLAGCGGVNRTMLAPARAPVDPATVRLYEVPPPGALQIAQIEATSGAGFGTQGQADAAVARLRQEAAKVGANGVVLMGVGTTPSAGGRSVGAGSFGSNVAGGIGIGIPTTQKKAAGVAILVPAAAVVPADQLPAR